MNKSAYFAALAIILSNGVFTSPGGRTARTKEDLDFVWKAEGDGSEITLGDEPTELNPLPSDGDMARLRERVKYLEEDLDHARSVDIRTGAETLEEAKARLAKPYNDQIEDLTKQAKFYQDGALEATKENESLKRQVADLQAQLNAKSVESVTGKIGTPTTETAEEAAEKQKSGVGNVGDLPPATPSGTTAETPGKPDAAITSLSGDPATKATGNNQSGNSRNR